MTIVDRDTCGDPALGEGCWNGLWWVSCGKRGCEGMCQYEGPCECRGCESPDCCYVKQLVFRDHQHSGGDRIFDSRPGIKRFRAVIEGPSVL